MAKVGVSINDGTITTVSPGRGSTWELQNGNDSTSASLSHERGKTSEVIKYESGGFNKTGARSKSEFKVENTTSSSVNFMLVQEVAAGSVAKIGIKAPSAAGETIPLSFSLPDSDPEFTIIAKKEKGS